MQKAIFAFLKKHSDIDINNINQLSTVDGPYTHKKDIIEEDSYIFDEINGSLKQEIVSYTYRTYIDHKIKVLILLDPNRILDEENAKDIAMCFVVSHHSMSQYYPNNLEKIYFFHIYNNSLDYLTQINEYQGCCEMNNKRSIPVYIKQLE